MKCHVNFKIESKVVYILRSFLANELFKWHFHLLMMKLQLEEAIILLKSLSILLPFILDNVAYVMHMLILYSVFAPLLI